VSVSDSGIGIARDDLKKLFKPFRQVDGSLTRKYGGSGLGLFIIAKLVGMMSGNIKVQSDEGKRILSVLLQNLKRL
jgi:signal transduction histidine kinase